MQEISGKELFKKALGDGIKKGWSGFLWVMKILVPISFFTLILDYSGIIERLDFLLAPVMGILSLPSVAALPRVIGFFSGIYGAVAAMLVLPMGPEEMMLVAIFLLISHNLIQEGAVQKMAGVSSIKSTLFRLSTSAVTVFICALFLKPQGHQVTSVALEQAVRGAFAPVFTEWALTTGALAIRIFFIIIAVLTALEVMKAFQVIPYILKPLTPLMRLMGLENKLGVLWLTAALFGLAYGSAVIVEETKANNFTEAELSRLHLSIGINHAMIEDPALFLPLFLSVGASSLFMGFWLWVPRFIAAIVAVQLLNVWQRAHTVSAKALP